MRLSLRAHAIVPTWLAAMVLATTCVCGNDIKPPPIPTRLQTPEPATAVAKNDPASPPSGSATSGKLDEGWWFDDGLGHAAMLARQRSDHAAAAEHLDALLATTDLSPDDRGAAELLRGYVHAELGEYVAAADRFATARMAPALAPLLSRVSLLEAQARLDASQPDLALPLAAQAVVEGSLVATQLVIHADAALRTNDTETAIAHYRRYLERYPQGGRRHEVRAKLASVLLEGDETERVAEAHRLFEQLLLDVPLSEYGARAHKALLEHPSASKRELSKSLRQSYELATLRALAQFNRHRQLARESEAFLRKRGLDHRSRCEAAYLRGSAVFRQRQRAAARPLLLDAAKACKTATWADLEVKSRYQAARGAYAAGEYSQAGDEFERLAERFPDHTYADDALILAGESWQDGGKPTAARAAYERSISRHPSGDMAGEARRRLLLLAFAEGRPDDAIALADAALQSGSLRAVEHAKLHYLRGRALQRLGRDDEAVAAWTAAITAFPLSYPALVALSRLRDHSDAAFATGIEVLERPPQNSRVGLHMPTNPAAERARLLARLGIHDAVREELDDAGVNGWPAVSVIARAGLYPEAQRMIANLGSTWRRDPPTSTNRELWELAHPLPFLEIVSPNESRYNLPSYLTFAVMQTESRFDPVVTSHAGAKGLIQLMPATAKGVAAKAGVRLDRDALYDPAVNLDLGMRFLASLIKRAGDPVAGPVLAVPSYNAGAGSVDRWLRERHDWDLDLWVEAIPYDETRKYAQSVLGRWFTYRWLYATDLMPADRIPHVPLTLGRG